MGSCRRWKRWSPGPLWLAELQKASCGKWWGWPGGEGLAGRKGRFGEASLLSLPILIFPSFVCVSISLCPTFPVISGNSVSLFYHLLGLGQNLLRLCVLGICMWAKLSCTRSSLLMGRGWGSHWSGREGH